ncbi:MAG TPA: hypothetical protein VHN79_04265, partial [Lacunisphaera sp.]|nr:hypothetical protein [Lacunisphaera sp.]
AVSVAVLNAATPTEAFYRFWENASGILKPGIAWLFFACLSGWLIHFVLSPWRADPDGPAQTAAG